MRKIVAKVGEYTNQQGEQKNQWLNVGVLMQNDKGPYIILDPCVDLPGVLMKQRDMSHKAGKKLSTGVMCSIFDGDQANQQGNQRAQQQPARQQPAQQSYNTPPQDGFDDYPDVPF